MPIKRKIRKTKSSSPAKRRNPEFLASRLEGEMFQDFYFYLTRIIDPSEGTFTDYSELEALSLSLQLLTFRGKLESYSQEILTPQVKKAIRSFASVLLKSGVEVAKEYGIDPRTGEVKG